MNAEIGLDKAEEELSERALDELVDRIMAHKYPPKSLGGHQINLRDILCECDQDRLAEFVSRALLTVNSSSIRRLRYLREGVEAIVRQTLRETTWHEKMKQQLFEESQ